MTMNEEAFLNKLAELAKVAPEALSDDTPIAPAEWDSVELLDLIAAIDDAYGVTVDTKQITATHTVREFRDLIAAARA